MKIAVNIVRVELTDERSVYSAAENKPGWLMLSQQRSAYMPPLQKGA